MSGAKPVLAVQTEPGTVVHTRFRAMLGELVHTWRQPAVVADQSGQALVPVDVPAGAWLDDAAVDYVTDLEVRVRTGDGFVSYSPAAFLVWPRGRERGPEVWTRAEQEVRAPNGVFRAELRTLAVDPRTRIMPSVGLDAGHRYSPPRPEDPALADTGRP